MSKSRRGAVRGAFTRTYNELMDELNKGKDSQPGVLKRGLRRLEDRFSQLDKLDEMVIQEMIDNNANQDNIDEEYDIRQEYRDKMNDITSMVEDICRPDEVDKASHKSSCCDGKSKYKLPKLKLVEFSGSPREWLSFWSQFKGIHEDEKLSPEEKFQYLIQATVPESAARRVVSSFPPTGENYQKAIDHLKSRFGKEKVLVEVYVRDLLKLVNGKQELSLSTLYDQLETQLRALESLGVTSDKYAAMLYPLVESALTEDVLVAWERIRNARGTIIGDDEDELNQLMEFLKGEVESNIRLKMAKHGISSEDEKSDEPPNKRRRIMFEAVTTTDLFNKEQGAVCSFCGKNHPSQDCASASKMTSKEKILKLQEGRKCFKCLKGNHLARTCRAAVKCQTCNGNHYKILCNKGQKINRFSTYSEEVCMQTLLVEGDGLNVRKTIRSLIDSGSGRSYVSTQAVKHFGFESVGTIEISHSLFGGTMTKLAKHSVYAVNLSSVDRQFQCEYHLVEVERICGPIGPTPRGPWLKELAMKGITLSDEVEQEYPIHIMFGVDIAFKLYTGRIVETKSGPVAFETKFGWTMMGPVNKPSSPEDNVSLIHSMFVKTAKLEDLWSLDIIGIHDPADKQSKDELSKSALLHFKENVVRLEDGRYEVALPWIEGHERVANNRDIAYRQLLSSSDRLKRLQKFEKYQQVFDEWLNLGIIERVPESERDNEEISYLPHHPVFNDKSLTTPIRPVFNASAKSNGLPSLNNCLEKGQNLLLEIPALLILFRMKPFAVISDIKKAFLQISVAQKDRDYLRFLWWENEKIVTLRHCRVVFGIASSPFLLGATINHHLDSKDSDTSKLLRKSIYVDNCITSVDTSQERDKFIKEATEICAEAKFELRGWVSNRGEVYTGDVPGVGSPECGLGTDSVASQETSIVSVLGLLWNVRNDTLSLDTRKFSKHNDVPLTKRNILAAIHQIFDPIGFMAPSLLRPKILLQELCKRKEKWDKIVPLEIQQKFLDWKTGVQLLANVQIPRWIGCKMDSQNSLHIFTDASQKAYASVAFLRSISNSMVNVQLLMAKSRLATMKPITISRLELIACECGAKMSSYLQKTIDMKNTEVYLWSDSSNALSWIKRKENWQVFVHNRVKTINQLTAVENWRHIPGNKNPADLPSRGCSNKQLIESRWWEGPDWLKREKEYWPQSEINCDEEIVMSEKRKVVISHVTGELESGRYLRYFSSFRKTIRMIAWMRRWLVYKRNHKSLGPLSTEEETAAEICLWRLVQKESFGTSEKFHKLKAIKDEFGVLRVETKLLLRFDTENFRRPILLPKDHPAVEKLIRYEHLALKHCGSQTLRNSLRESYWIIKVGVAIRRITSACKGCTRHSSKKLTAPEASLPPNRVNDAAVFEIVGIDLGGPLYLIDEKKSWFVIFTCAVYRAIHLELITSLSTEGFIQALRRFISRRGRPRVNYTDHGSNFEGTENLMAKLDWGEIVTHSEARRIKWIFNPPKAPWWGGWWERLVGLVKQLLRKNLGRQSLDYEEMATVLCDFEQIINLRPLTYMSEDPNELMAITPMMFLTEAKSNEVMDLDMIETIAFKEKFKHRQKIRQELRDRFRNEYLSLLVHKNVKNIGHNAIQVGDVVLVELDNLKRVHWPIARVVEVFPSIDGTIRSVKVKLFKDGKFGEMERPIQRLYMLETSKREINEMVGDAKSKVDMEQKNGGVQVSSSSGIIEVGSSHHGEKTTSNDIGEGIVVETPKVTRSGRVIRKPLRY